MLGLVLPAALVFGVFYGYYHIFVPRYFYIVSLWMSLLAGYGLYAALTLLTRCIPIRVRGAAGWAVLLLCAAVAGREILDTPRSRSGFRIPQARALAREFESVLPPQAVVLAPRNMCEVVSLFAGRTSYPAPLWQEGDKPLYPALNAHVRAILDAGRPVFAMEVPWRDIPWRDAPWGDSIHLRRLFDLVPVREFSPDDYRMQVYSRDRFRLHEVRRWTRHEVSGRLPELPGLPDYRAWVAVDAGALSVADPARTWTRVTVSGIPVAESVRDGANYFALPASIRATDRPLELALHSDGLLPAEIRLWAAPLSTPIDISFDFFHAFDHWPRWAGDILPPSPSERIPRLIGDATFEVPVPAPEAGRVVLEWRLRSNRREEGLSHRIAFHEGGAQLAEAAIPCDLNVHGAVVTLPPRPAADHRTIRISRQPNTGDVASARDGGPSPAWVDALEVYRLFVFRLGAADCVDIEVGGELDTPFIRSGFHPRPTPHPARRPFRWTDGHGTVDLPLAPSGRDMELLVEYSDRRADVPLYVPEMRFNGSPVAPESVVPDATGRNRLWRGRVPAAVAGAENTLEIVSGAWRPCDTDPESADDRTLGILIHRVRLAPHP
jgi:transposase